MAAGSVTGSFNATQTSVHSTESTEPTIAAEQLHHGLKAGTVAGIAVGALVAGALIAGLAFLFLLRRQRRNQATVAASRTHSYRNRHTEKPTNSSTTVAHVAANNIDDMLPQPVADDDIIDSLSKIRDNIKNHARSYYHSDPVPTSEIDEAALQVVADCTGVSTALLVHSLLNPLTRLAAIRLVLGCIILSRCDEECDPSLLPRQLADLAILIPGKRDCK